MFLAYTLSVPGIEIKICGLDIRRENKVKALSEFDIAQKYLRVCVKSARNCNICFKCIRTLLEIDMIGKLEEYRDVFDIEFYLKHRVDIYFSKMVMDSKNDFLNPIYKYFSKKEPILVTKAKIRTFLPRVIRKIKRLVNK